MSARFPTRWLFAAALLAAAGLASAAAAAPPQLPIDPKGNGLPQTAPAPVPTAGRPLRLLAEPQLLEQEKFSEFGDGPPPPTTPAPAEPQRPTVNKGAPDCGPTVVEAVNRCLRFSCGPLAAFFQVQTCAPPESATLPAPTPPEEIGVMPTEVEQIEAMPAEEASEPPYEYLALPPTGPHCLALPPYPLGDIKTTTTGSALFGVGVNSDAGLTGSIVVNAEPLSVTPSAKPIPAAPPAVEQKQVMLKVMVAEVSRGAARCMGMGFTLNKKQQWEPVPLPTVVDNGRVKLLIQAARDENLARLLAEPTLLAQDGRTATFFSGTEYPVAVPVPGSDRKGVTYVPVGVALQFTPVITDKDRIRLQVIATIGSGTPADLTSQTFGAEVEMRDGQTFAVGGLKWTASATAGTPGSGCLSVAGGLIEAADAAASARDLALLVTPELVKPAPAVPGHAAAGATKATRSTCERAAAIPEESVHDLLVKCQRELSRHHFAAAEELAQEALTRDRKAVEADPLVYKCNLLQQVKAVAELPLGTVEPCAAKKDGRGDVEAGRAKAIGSTERMTQALMEEFNEAYKQGKYGEAERLARRAQELGPENACVTAAVTIATRQHNLQRYVASMNAAPPAPPHKKTKREREIEQALGNPVNFNFNDVPLGTVIDELATMHQINIVPDVNALQDQGISLERPMSMRLENVPLKSALKLLFSQVGLAYVVEDDVLKVTTSEIARGKHELRTYQVGDLVKAGGATAAKGKEGPNGEARLIDLIQSAVAPRSWASNGGKGTIEYFPKAQALVVNQPADLQEQITGLLEALSRPFAGKAPREQAAEAMARFNADFKQGHYDEAKTDALQALCAAPGDPAAFAALRQSCVALSRQPHAEGPAHCSYVPMNGTGLVPALPPSDPAVVRALEKLLLEGDKGAEPRGGTEEAEPKGDAPRP